MARPTKLTEETSAAIVKALAIGATRKDAAGAAGVDYRTFLNWMEAGQQARSGAFFQFFQACTQAEHKARLNYLSVIAKAANEGDWRAALEYLKRRDRETWGDNMDVTSGGKDISALLREGRDRVARMKGAE
jgi:hypothetical protein